MCCGAAALLVTRAGAADWKLSAAVDYSTGDYGTADDTEFLYVPLSLKRYFDSGALAATVSYVGVDTSGPDGTSADGAGDTLLKGWYYATDQRGVWPGVDVVARLKMPTADEDEGLGTGEFDAGIGVENYYWFDANWCGYLDLAYNFIGDPPDRSYDNQVVWDIGAGRRYARWWHGVFFEDRTAIVPGEDDALSIYYAPAYRIDRRMELTGLAAVGLSDGAPDYELSAGISHRF